MTRVEHIEKAVEQLSPQELARFRAWFEEFDARVLDARRSSAMLKRAGLTR